MPSPFPGMDPYLEDPAFWADFHDRFIVYWRDALNDRLPENYEARVNARTRLFDLEAGLKSLPKPDVAVHRDDRPHAVRNGHGTVATLEPVTIPFCRLEEIRETYIEIRRRPDRTVVAVLELLSPSNKTGGDRLLYLDRRNALLHQDVHIVDLDLLRGGERIPLGAPLPRGDYFMFVSHVERRLECDVYAWTLRDPLPTVPIPLISPDSHVLINLAAVFTETYDRGRYGRVIDYAQPPVVALSEPDRAWVAELLKANPN